MSLNSMANVAVKHLVQHQTPTHDEDARHKVYLNCPPQPPEHPPKPLALDTATNLLIGYIPTEIITIYVAVGAALRGEIDGTPSAAWTQATAWAVFWIFVVATPFVFWLVYSAKVKAAGKPLPLRFAAWPLWEMAAATLAFCAWAMALPATPFIEYEWYSSALAGVVVLIASTLLTLLAPLFQRSR